ncbi:AAA domain-containing protein [Kribbella qitaiheensis]|uniref:AAA domain-containing protein n=1 Tax=Kribbella qitaiheensis TaxID=1544730 RepID=UPI003620EB5A
MEQESATELTSGMKEGRSPLVERAMNLFEFLARAQQLKTAPPRTTDAYEREGSVTWFADLPDHWAIASAHRSAIVEPDGPILTVERVPRTEAPIPEDALAPWLAGPIDDPERVPRLRESIHRSESPEAGVSSEPDPIEVTSSMVLIEDMPDVITAYNMWLKDWQSWAGQELRDQAVRLLYGELFSTHVTAAGHAEEFELVVGVGCLGWKPDGYSPVSRHLFTAAAAINLDADSGRLTVVREPAIDTVTVELDMLDPHLITNPQRINELKSEARGFESHLLDRDEIGILARRFVHTLDAGGEYFDTDTAPECRADAVAAYAPALILRKRSQQGLVEIFQTIVAQLAESDEVPSGLLPLIDPDHVPAALSDSAEGGMVSIDDEVFLPLPVNDIQLKIIRKVDTSAQTLVQGPPGTGKTHTAAALLSHLLAQGKRVLVAAHTDRALKEVRDKLPAAIKPLSVAVVGTSRSDMSDLKLAVERIASTAADHDADEAVRAIEQAVLSIDELRRQRAETHRQLIEAREQEVGTHQHGGYDGTLAAIAQKYQSQAEEFRWLAQHATVLPTEAVPLTDAEIVEWHSYLLDEELVEDEADAALRLIDVESIPLPHQFADLRAQERDAAAIANGHGDLNAHHAFDAVSRLEASERTPLQDRMRALAQVAGELEQRSEAWMNEALFDIRAGRAGLWQVRSSQISQLIDRTRPLADALGPITEVTVSGGDIGALTALAQHLHEHVSNGGSVKTAADGSPKLGAFTAKAVKQAKPLLDNVRVDQLPPTTEHQLRMFLTFVEAERSVNALDKAWPSNVNIPPEGTLRERLQWHTTELQQLNRVLNLGERLAVEEQSLASLGLPRPDWHDLMAVHTYANLVDAAAAKDALAAAAQPLEALEEAIETATRWLDAAPCVQHLHLAVRRRDHDEYAAAHGRLKRLHEVRSTAARRDELAARLASGALALRQTIEQSPADPRWSSRLPNLAAAWSWAGTGVWILEQDTTDINALQAKITVIEERLRREVETLAATRAWNHAVSPGRLTGQARADLTQYAQLVRRMGKGTGKYAAQQRAEIRKAMDRCRPAVPVWIMPIYRVAEQLQIEQNMFDVVIVDEASQAGLEATFLQYLAPKIVVIGDDKQVSPVAVGVDQQGLRDLANQYLADDRYKASWQDPKRSLFDEARMRYGSMITLTEHRRCVPEIIGFSNRIAYEPDGIRLIPVRQYGADRLEPIKAVFLSDGYQKGTTNKVNPPEVDAIVDQIEKCLSDPRYDGLTFGVVSLLGGAQAKAIEAGLLERIPPEEWAARDLRCGDAADFQGSERDVMFLSMVAAAEVGRRLGTLTQDLYVQRYNVAVSRAKDQLWLFHSVAIGDVSNPADMRFQLLDYCYGVINRLQTDDDGVVKHDVPENALVEPFDSLFEQRVFNRLIDRGYTVIPQFPANGYRLDLVVVGPKGRLAIECDGDAWHGPDVYERDLARQRDLERCGWQFFRIRESAFYVDQAGALDALWGTLSELGIHPSGWLSEEMDDAADAEADSGQDGKGGVELSTDDQYEHMGMSKLSAPHDIAPSIAGAVGRVAVDEDFVNEPATFADDVAELDPLVPSAVDRSRELAPYAEYTGILPSAVTATKHDLIRGIRSIVAVEGPVEGHRLHTAYVRASGGHRVGKQIAKALNSAIVIAVRQGTLLADNPLEQSGVKPRTYRLPDQPELTVRQLGPRPLEHVPPRELAALIADAADVHGWDSDEVLFRQVLDQLGLRRLTTNVEARLAAVLSLARDVSAGEQETAGISVTQVNDEGREA